MSKSIVVPASTLVTHDQLEKHSIALKSDKNGVPNANAITKAQQRYAAERDKRLRPDGLGQYIFLDRSSDDRLREYREDPWLDERSQTITLHDGDSIKHLILGAGISGLLASVRLIQAGIDSNDIYVIDEAGGWGGTWYYNRYPGIMCDVESYCYLPLLQETGYMPKHRYAYGHEIRSYISNTAHRYGLDERAMFRTKINSATWDDSTKEWVIQMTKARHGNGGSQDPLQMIVRAQFFSHFSGVHHHVKLPEVPGLLDYEGHMFHTARWDYAYTGGSPSDPKLSRLQDKRVGIVGTGASAVQIVPELARWAKELYVFQRTPASVDYRGQAPTDLEWWQSNIQNSLGWWNKRNANLAESVSGNLSDNDVKLVDDKCAGLTAYRIIFGGRGHSVAPDKIPEFLAEAHAEDLPRADRIRARVDEVVRDHETAAKLKSWYPTWCKRPTFHDAYLASFNQPNLHLVDTDGKGIESITSKGLRAGGVEYPLDVVIWATGYRGPRVGWLEARSGMTIIGRDGRSFDNKWDENVATIHGAMTNGFPNLFLMGVFQSGMTLNWTYAVDTMTTHTAYIVFEAEKKANALKEGAKWSVEPSKEAEEEWSRQVLMHTGAGIALQGCTPNYSNDEGMTDRLPIEKKLKLARSSSWGAGIEDYRRVIARWREEGKLKGLEIRTA